MYRFKNDYSEACHPRILESLLANRMEQNEGYGLDDHSLRAMGYIKKLIGCETADVHLLVGGTQTNQTALAAFMRPHHAVISSSVGHINVHETGAIEATGHKVLTRPTEDGKLTPAMVQSILDEHPSDEHMVKPHIVYISNSTEEGSIYSKKELQALKAICDEKGLLFYLDGARLGSALRSKENDVDITDLPKLFDAFYIGATKNGGMMGEALVIVNDDLKEDFRYLLKQRGGMLAKGAMLGIQFEELFKDNLFWELADHANAMAEKIRIAIREAGCPVLTESPTNLLFPILPNDVLAELEKDYIFSVYSVPDEGHTCIRIVTSWATLEEQVDKLCADIKRLYHK